ncbi:hypothetical protein [Sphingomonas desiccabilis]|uniref:hypothetical protein n=1 Tax=Sphingomonas desiccabilis TaxID=429134 RepID=UPI00185060B9|nr:hypothetical protein [Sphingomonas desiccabilis]MBB3909626.1 hypothetical protein [Sphingomonas desiccabilis]
MASLLVTFALAASYWRVIELGPSLEKLMFACLVIGLLAITTIEWAEKVGRSTGSTPAIANRPPVAQNARTEISIIFEPAFQGQKAGAVWIVESDENRRWFKKQSDLDAGSALFAPEGKEIGHGAILRSVWNVQEHYADWSRITVSGVVLTNELARELRDEGNIVGTEEGFALVRA